MNRIQNSRDQAHSEVIRKSGGLKQYSQKAKQHIKKKSRLWLYRPGLTSDDMYSTLSDIYTQYNGHFTRGQAVLGDVEREQSDSFLE